MRWYEGGISDAVAASKSKRAVFVVFIEGKDDTSAKLSSLINNQEVSTKLESDDFVAIKIEANSLPHQQFSQIYPQAVVPSLFFIGKTGAPLETLTDVPSLEDFTNKLAVVLEKHSGKKQQSTAFIKTEQSASNSEVVCENGVCRMKESQPSISNEAVASSPPGDSSSENAISTEEKVERAKELIEQKREAKEMEEKEKERQKEIERRQMGQNVQKLKRWQEDQELKSLMEEREKEKREQQAARERILAQIAQDKAERAAKFSNSPQPQPQAEVSPQPVKRNPADMSRARLQFKLPDGSSHAHDFGSSETLQSVRNYILSNMKLPFSNYVLSTAFPRREFTDNNDSETLADLGLVPSAVVLILPINQGVISTNAGGGSLSLLFWSFLSPFLGIFDYLKNFVFGRPNQQQASPKETVKRPAETGESSRVPPKKRVGETTVVRRQGNIHRLSDRTDSDDDNNTWNGNSTQQM